MSASFNSTVKIVQENIQLSAQLQDSFAREMSILPDDPPACAFGMVHNMSVLNFELLDHYLQHWRRHDRSFGLDPNAHMDLEQAQRVHNIGRFVFTGALSQFEFTAKETVKKVHRDIQMPQKKKLYLRDILEASAAAGCVAGDDIRTWRELLDLRNGCVHNNSVFDRDELARICGRDVTFRRGRQAQAHLDFFPMCNNWMLRAFDQWGRAYLQHRR